MIDAHLPTWTFFALYVMAAVGHWLCLEIVSLQAGQLGSTSWRWTWRAGASVFWPLVSLGLLLLLIMFACWPPVDPLDDLRVDP